MFHFSLGQISQFELNQNQSFHRLECPGFFFEIKKPQKGQKRRKLSDSLGSDDDRGSFQAFIRRASSSSAGQNGGSVSERASLTMLLEANPAAGQPQRHHTPGSSRHLHRHHHPGSEWAVSHKRWRERQGKSVGGGHNTIVCPRPRG